MHKTIALGILLIELLSQATIQAMIKTSSASSQDTAKLLLAVEKGDLDRVIQLLYDGASANVAGPQRETPLLIAARNNQKQIVQLLLLSAKGTIDVNAVDNNGWGPLFAAALNGHRQIVNMLLKAGADANKRTTGLTYSEIVAQQEDMQMLLENTGCTPLIGAARSGHAKIVEMLLQHKAAVDQAAENKLGIRDENDRVAVHKLQSAGSDLSKASQNGCTPLFAAASSGHLDIVQILLKAQADVNQADHGGRTPLHIAAEYGENVIVKALLDARADVKKADSKGCTPLFVASRRGHLDIVQILLRAHSDPLAVTNLGSTALHTAAEYGHAALVRVLLATGVDVNSARNNGSTPLHCASLYGELDTVRILLTAGANPHLTTSEDHPEGYALRLREGQVLVSTTSSGNRLRGLKPINCATEVYRQLAKLLSEVESTNPHLQAYESQLNMYKEIIVLLSLHDLEKLIAMQSPSVCSPDKPDYLESGDNAEKRDQEAAELEDPHGKRIKADDQSSII